MDKHIAMRTAKASQEDIDGGLDLAAILDAIGKDAYPSHFVTPKDRAAADEATNISTWFDPNAFDHLQHLRRLLADLLEHRPGFPLWWLATGRDTTPRNDILDSDDGCPAIHLKSAVENKQLRDALATLIGFGDVVELRSTEPAVWQMVHPDKAKAIAINTIHVPLATAPKAVVSRDPDPRTQGVSPLRCHG